MLVSGVSFGVIANIVAPEMVIYIFYVILFIFLTGYMSWKTYKILTNENIQLQSVKPDVDINKTELVAAV